MSLTTKKKEIWIEMKNLILKTSKEELENIELEKLVVSGNTNLKMIQMIISDAMSILSGEITGIHGLGLKP